MGTRENVIMRMITTVDRHAWLRGRAADRHSERNSGARALLPGTPLARTPEAAGPLQAQKKAPTTLEASRGHPASWGALGTLKRSTIVNALGEVAVPDRADGPNCPIVSIF
jgi:hypothetical protein